MSLLAVDWEGAILLVGGVLATAAFVAFGYFAGRYLDQPETHGAPAGEPRTPARITPARITPAGHAALLMAMVAGLAVMIWMVVL